MNTMKLENKLKRKEVIPNNEVRKESEMKTGIGDNEVLKIALKKELKKIEWTEVNNISETKKEDKSQAIIQ